MNKIIKIIELLFSLKQFGVRKFFFMKNKFRISRNSILEIDSSVKMKNVSLHLNENSVLKIAKGVELNNVIISVKGTLIIEENSILNNGYSYKKLNISINNGKLMIGSKNRIQCDFLIRYGGIVVIGDNNNINSESEIRCDESIKIGNYNQISYKVLIWDTNTHNIYSANKRRELTDNYFPIFGYEFEKPTTKAVQIGNDCWISRDVSILKGTNIGNKCIIGHKVMLSKNNIENSNTVVSNNVLKIFPNNL